ncbi:HAD family hydrolase [Marinitenerispora sediminis]|uniref:HAD family hydrolase n=1 Tax=Marinitenerispora sediminis TaxID=1931232 RepID=A0A368T422_9ACTN|nr:HAD family hydrolase [Marinitenerispora sediminis]RCV52689.1 HAD family hydrolase [Marinitenerispora sediminis]RCV53147.1 HAD family hydrolase [Marinitenerispora sediminis]
MVFDYGEVVSEPPSAEARARLERLADAPAAEFWSAYWAERPPYDAGLAASEYWRRVAARLGAEWDLARVQRLAAADLDSWLRVAPASAATLRRLAARGVRLALLSNAPHALAGALRADPVLEGFDALFFSCDLGACKPDPAVYRRVLAELGTPAERTLFVDDREENVLAAKRLGIDAHHYAGPEELERFLTARLGAF